LELLEKTQSGLIGVSVVIGVCGFKGAVTIVTLGNHTAVLSEDGSNIIVLGGWVGDIAKLPIHSSLFSSYPFDVNKLNKPYLGPAGLTWCSSGYVSKLARDLRI
jgi:hypothetical protein